MLPRLGVRVLYSTLILLLMISAAAYADSDQALTCRFEFEQTFTKSDITSPGPISRPIPEADVYTFIFNRSTRKGTYVYEYGTLGTGSGQIVLLEEGTGRLSFYEGNVLGDNLFFLTIFTGKKLSDGRHPAVMSSHAWMTGNKNIRGEEEFLPKQRIGRCR